MKKPGNILHKWRKVTAVLLLLNFMTFSLFNAFPQEECNGFCEMDLVVHKCNMDTSELMEMSCCEMMEMNSQNKMVKSSPCGMEFSDLDCALVFHSQNNPTYLIPKIIDNEIELIQITTRYFNENNSNIELFEFDQDNFYRKKPPIFLTNSVFLI